MTTTRPFGPLSFCRWAALLLAACLGAMAPLVAAEVVPPLRVLLAGLAHGHAGGFLRQAEERLQPRCAPRSTRLRQRLPTSRR